MAHTWMTEIVNSEKTLPCFQHTLFRTVLSKTDHFYHASHLHSLRPLCPLWSPLDYPLFPSGHNILPSFAWTLNSHERQGIWGWCVKYFSTSSAMFHKFLIGSHVFWSSSYPTHLISRYHHFAWHLCPCTPFMSNSLSQTISWSCLHGRSVPMLGWKAFKILMFIIGWIWIDDGNHSL